MNKDYCGKKCPRRPKKDPIDTGWVYLGILFVISEIFLAFIAPISFLILFIVWASLWMISEELGL